MADVWMARAACVPAGWTLFERTYRWDPQPALAVCAACPVLQECRDYTAPDYWAGVVIAGWLAPVDKPARPPWAGAR